MARYKVCGDEQVRDTSLDTYTKIGYWGEDDNVDDEVAFTLSNGDHINIHLDWESDAIY